MPEHPLDRLDWQKRASSIGTWRELSGYDHPTDPIGPEPAAATDTRAAWAPQWVGDELRQIRAAATGHPR